MAASGSASRTVIIAGGRGAIGRALSRWLYDRGYTVVVLTRCPVHSTPSRIRYEQWDGQTPGRWTSLLPTACALVNLTGKSLFTFWTKRTKQQIWDSRVRTTQLLATAVRQYAPDSFTFISASAIGYYGNLGERECDEQCPPGNDFLARLCIAWEDAAMQAAERKDIRVVIPRIGIVLQPDAGFLHLLRRSYRYGLCAYPGDGRQWISWIHIQDLIRSIDAAITQPWNGVYNAVAPQPVQLRQLIATLAQHLHRCPGIPIPPALLRLLGETATLALSSQQIRPVRLQQWGFSFQFPDLATALHSLLS